MKFGVQIENHLGISYDGVRKISSEAEQLGFDGLFICDHLMGRNEETFPQPCVDPWVTLGALARETKKMTLGTLASAVGFRYPSMLAKMGATVDSISGGRFQLTIGAGWNEPEYKAYGIPFPSIGVRMRELREAIQIIRLMWTQDQATFHGRRFKIDGAWCYPRPNSPKIWVGGGGEKMLLRIVAELADGWNAVSVGLEEYQRKLTVLESHCNAAGRRVEDIERSYYSPALVAKTETEFLDLFKKHYGQYKKQDETMDAFVQRMRSSRPLIGTAKEVSENIEKFRELGVSYLIVYFLDKEQLGLMRQFAKQVMPQFRNVS